MRGGWIEKSKGSSCLRFDVVVFCAKAVIHVVIFLCCRSVGQYTLVTKFLSLSVSEVCGHYYCQYLYCQCICPELQLDGEKTISTSLQPGEERGGLKGL